jgi:hypothetical protein
LKGKQTEAVAVAEQRKFDFFMVFHSYREREEYGDESRLLAVTLFIHKLA